MYKIRTCYILEDTLYTLLRFDQKIKLFDHFLFFEKYNFQVNFQLKIDTFFTYKQCAKHLVQRLEILFRIMCQENKKVWRIIDRNINL
jgi:hypothetical protein